MRNRTVIILLLIGMFNLSNAAALTSFEGKWLTQGSYDVNSLYDGEPLNKTDEFSGKKLILKKNKKAIVKLNDYNIRGTWKQKSDKKFVIYLDKNKIEDIAGDYVNDEYGTILDYTDVNIDVNKNKIIGKMLSDNSIKCRGKIDADADIIFKEFLIEKKLGTVSFNGKLNFTGVKQ